MQANLILWLTLPFLFSFIFVALFPPLTWFIAPSLPLPPFSSLKAFRYCFDPAFFPYILFAFFPFSEKVMGLFRTPGSSSRCFETPGSRHSIRS